MGVNYREIAIPELFKLLQKKLIALKNHTYWENPTVNVYKKEINPKFREIMDICYGFECRCGFDDNIPFLAMYRESYHMFNGKLSNLDYADSKFDFKPYLIMLKDYINMVQVFIDGETDPNSYKLRIPCKRNGVYELDTCMPMYHENWTSKYGYGFAKNEQKWHNVICHPKSDKIKLFKRFKEKIRALKKNRKENNKKVTDLWIDFYYACIKDVNEGTSLRYHLY